MARQRGAAAAREQTECVVEPARDLLGATARGRAPRPARSRAGCSRAGGRSPPPRSVFAELSANDGSVARARSTNSCIASALASGGTSHAVSLATPSASRLVARMVMRGQLRSSASTISADASTRCSQLSSTMSARASQSEPTSA